MNAAILFGCDDHQETQHSPLNLLKLQLKVTEKKNTKLPLPSCFDGLNVLTNRRRSGLV